MNTDKKKRISRRGTQKDADKWLVLAGVEGAVSELSD